MNKPPGLNALLFATTTESSELGSVETPPILRLIRPATFVIWLLVFCIEAQTVISTGNNANFLVLILSTALFAGVHMQFWYEESEQGQRFHRTLERMRGRIYEDDSTGLPNSRHFVFELRRQMMRSVRNGRGFSLVLTDIGGNDKAKNIEQRILPGITKVLRQSLGESDFVAHLPGMHFRGDGSGRPRPIGGGEGGRAADRDWLVHSAGTRGNAVSGRFVHRIRGRTGSARLSAAGTAGPPRSALPLHDHGRGSHATLGADRGGSMIEQAFSCPGS